MRNAFTGNGDAVVQTRDVHGGVHVHSSRDPHTPTPRQLPADTAVFTGRSTELRRLDALLASADDPTPATVMLATISGPAGVGKTALAVHWARSIRDRFPDGDLYVDLRGYASGAAAEVEDVLERFLRALDVPAERIPHGLEARAALYRSLLDRRRMLIVLDNAANSRHVRTLLPGSAGCLVVVTSRRRLFGLVANGGAYALSLNPILPSEAVALLDQIVGTARTGQDPKAVAELAHRCGYLPLALRIAAERATARPDVTMADLSAELADDDHRLDVLTADDDETVAVRTAFSWSCRTLPDDAAWLFGLLGLHTGQRIGVPVIAALADITPDRAKQLLDVLVDCNLLDRVGVERYQFQPLLHLYAVECSLVEETSARQAAVLRMLEWYLRSASAAERAIKRSGPPNSTISPGGTASFRTPAESLAWYDLECANIASTIRQAAEAGHEVLAWRLAHTFSHFLVLRNRSVDLSDLAEIGLAAARKMWDERGEAHMLIMIGLAAAGVGDIDTAIKKFQESLAVWWAIGDRAGKCNALNEIGVALRELRQFDDAVDYLQRCRDSSRATNNRVTEGYALHNLGETLLQLGRPEEAAGHLHEALAVRQETGDRWTQSMTLTGLGNAYQELRQPDTASYFFHQALELRADGDQTMALEQQ
jgi:tetratricopeptide (TPR) repeat protein